MYMHALESEVEALSAEVMRLRLMLQRVTQVMELPPLTQRHYADPMAATLGHAEYPIPKTGGPRREYPIELVEQLLKTRHYYPSHSRSRPRTGRSSRGHRAASRRQRHRQSLHRSPSPSESSSMRSTHVESSYGSSQSSRRQSPEKGRTRASRRACKQHDTVRFESASPVPSGPPAVSARNKEPSVVEIPKAPVTKGTVENAITPPDAISEPPSARKAFQISQMLPPKSSMSSSSIMPPACSGKQKKPTPQYSTSDSSICEIKRMSTFKTRSPQPSAPTDLKMATDADAPESSTTTTARSSSGLDSKKPSGSGRKGANTEQSDTRSDHVVTAQGKPGDVKEASMSIRLHKGEMVPNQTTIMASGSSSSESDGVVLGIHAPLGGTPRAAAAGPGLPLPSTSHVSLDRSPQQQPGVRTAQLLNIVERLRQAAEDDTSTSSSSPSSSSKESRRRNNREVCDEAANRPNASPVSSSSIAHRMRRADTSLGNTTESVANIRSMGFSPRDLNSFGIGTPQSPIPLQTGNSESQQSQLPPRSVAFDYDLCLSTSRSLQHTPVSLGVLPWQSGQTGESDDGSGVTPSYGGYEY